MEVLNGARIVGNAFRVLGLPAGASQADIDASARRMRIWSDPAQIPATAWDLPWLGPVGRARNQIEQAVVRLSDPISRIEERLLWFADQTAAKDPAFHKAPDAPGGLRGPSYFHDLSLGWLSTLLRDDSDAQREIQWCSVLAALVSAIGDDAYRQWFLDVEEQSDFEKRASALEIGDALAGVAESVTSALAARARDALDRDKYQACIRYMKVMRSVTREPEIFDPHRASVCDWLEDLVVLNCNRLLNQIFHDVNWQTKHWRRYSKVNRKACKKSAAEIEERVEPLISTLTAIAGEDSERMKRIGLPAAGMYRNLGLAWRRAQKPSLAGRALRTARRFAGGTVMEAEVEADIRDWSRRKKKIKSPAGVVLGILLWLFVAILSSNSTPNSPSAPSVPNFTMPKMPDFSDPKWQAMPRIERSTDPTQPSGTTQPAAAPDNP